MENSERLEKLNEFREKLELSELSLDYNYHEPDRSLFVYLKNYKDVVKYIKINNVPNDLDVINQSIKLEHLKLIKEEEDKQQEYINNYIKSKIKEEQIIHYYANKAIIKLIDNYYFGKIKDSVSWTAKVVLECTNIENTTIEEELFITPDDILNCVKQLITQHGFIIFGDKIEKAET